MNYNYIAPFYDTLSRICFLNNQQKAHYTILPYLKNEMKILWIGGGSGWFLKTLDHLNIELSIDYVEYSLVMLNQAKKRKCNHLNINFYHDDIFKFETSKTYDLIITAFLFDHFSENECQRLFKKLAQYLKDDGFWFYVDFNEKQNFIQRFLTKSMVLFFQFVAGIHSNDFPKIEILFKDFQLVEEHFFFGNYITSKIFIK